MSNTATAPTTIQSISFRTFSEKSIEILAYARAVRSQMNPESGSGGANRGKYRKPIRPQFC